MTVSRDSEAGKPPRAPWWYIAPPLSVVLLLVALVLGWIAIDKLAAWDLERRGEPTYTIPDGY